MKIHCTVSNHLEQKYPTLFTILGIDNLSHFDCSARNGCPKQAQHLVSGSTAESEFRSMANLTAELVWIKSLPLSGVIIKVLVICQLIQFYIPGPSILNWICSLFEKKSYRSK